VALRERRRERALSQEFLDRLKAYYGAQGREGELNNEDEREGN
jgi:hypothetical protein